MEKWSEEEEEEEDRLPEREPTILCELGLELGKKFLGTLSVGHKIGIFCHV